MSKKIFAVIAGLLMVAGVFTADAMAGEATRVYMELSKSLTNPFDASPIRGRVILLDAAGNVADSYGTKPIAEAKLILTSENFGSQVAFADVPAYVDPMFGGPGSIEIIMGGASHEFAISYSYPSVTEFGDDNIIATIISEGAAPIGNKYPVVVEKPLANCYVVRTGGILPVVLSNLDVLDDLPPQQFNNFAVQPAGQDVKIDVFAALGLDNDLNGIYDTFLFTDRVPEGAETVTITGETNTIDNERLVVQSASATLVNGHAALNVPVNNLKIPAIMAAKDFATPDEQLTFLEGVFSSGLELGWGAAASITREIGAIPGDVIPGGQVGISSAQLIGNSMLDPEESDEFLDFSTHKPASIAKASMVGLPIGPITDTDGLQGYFDNDSIDPDEVAVSPLDAYLYVENPTQTAGIVAYVAPIYAAIMGWDNFDNPAYFPPKQGVPASFKISTTIEDFYALPDYGTVADSTYTPNSSYPTFIPFAVGAGGPVEATIQASILNGVKLQASFDADPIIVDLISPTSISVKAGETATVKVQNAEDNGYELRALQHDGTSIKVGLEGGAPSATVQVPCENITCTYAMQDVAFFTKAEEPIHLIFKSATDKNITGAKKIGGTIDPADPAKFEPSAIMFKLTKASVTIDCAEEHQTIAVQNPDIMIHDAFGNPYDVFTEVSPTVALYLNDGTTPYPGTAAAKTAVDDMIMATFDKDQVAPDASSAILTVSTGITETASASLPVDVRAMQKSVLSEIFVPVPDIIAPLAFYYGDQNGALIAPNVLASGSFGKFVATITSTDGTIGFDGSPAATSLDVTLSTDEPQEVITVAADADKTVVKLAVTPTDACVPELRQDVVFAPDFEPPVVQSPLVAGSCAFLINITDNRAVNLAATQVSIIGPNFQPVEPVSRTNLNDGTAEGTIKIAVGAPGTYQVTINTIDKANNPGATSVQVVTVECNAACASVDPNSVIADTEKTLDVTITGQNTNFTGAVAVTFSCPQITVNSASIVSPTQVTANITVPAATEDYTCDVTVATTLDEVTCAQGFEVLKPITACNITSISPSSGTQGAQDLTLTITGSNFDPAQAVTVSFSGTGITVVDSTVNSETQITAVIDIAETAAVGARTVTVRQGDISCTGQFTVNELPVEECTLTVEGGLLPLKAGLFPRLRRIVITGNESANWNRTSAVTIEDIRLVIPLRIQPNKITAVILIPGKLFGRFTPGVKDVTVVTGADTCTGTVTIQ